MTEYAEPSAPPVYQDGAEVRTKAGESRPAPDALPSEQPPAKAARHDDNSYASKGQPAPAQEQPQGAAGNAGQGAAADSGQGGGEQQPLGQYESIDFLGNVPGGPHAAAAEALATFSSSVGSESANNAQQFVPVNQPSSQGAPQSGPPFICPTCNTSYSRLEYLRRHERRHADIRPFVCPCGKSFSRSDVLARHKTKCRVVLSGEGGAAADTGADASRGKPQERPARGAGGSLRRTSRGRESGERGRRGSDREELSEISVDPALSGQVDPSLQPPPPPPPLEHGAGEGEAPPDSYAADQGYAAHHPHYTEGDYGGHGKGAGAHYGSASRAHPAHMMDSKLYSPSSKHSGAPIPPRGGSGAYVSGAPAIHPELSSRGLGSGSNTPNHGAHGGYYAHGEPGAYSGYGSHYEGALQAPPQQGSAPSGNAAPPASGGQGGALGKEPTRFSMSSGPMSPFSNTAIGSSMSPYLSAFSCARDTPHSTSPRAAPATTGSASSSAPAHAPAPGQGGASGSGPAPHGDAKSQEYS